VISRTSGAIAILFVLLIGSGCGKDPDDLAPPAGGSGGAGGGLAGGATFRWRSTAPLVAPIQDANHPILSVKDPSIVYFDGRWHLFATTANTSGSWSMIYLSFAEWSEAASAQPYYLDNNPALRGYHAAPQIFYFTPQSRWYLVFQSGQPQYSTTTDIARPESWGTPINFFAAEPAIVTMNKGMGGWLDFFVICDEANCHLFFTDDNGHLYRSQTGIGSFPSGFGDPVIVMSGTKETLFEGSAHYRLKGMNSYLTIVEAFGPSGQRYYRSFAADRLDDVWSPLADNWTTPFAGQNNVTFETGATAWTRDFSHGELLRDGYDQTLTVDRSNLQFLYQGVDPAATNVEYFRLPYRLALLRPDTAP
jgi:hypothetical protein